MTLPRFLIIGAMKAGTTTLYEDLLSVSGVWLPPQKEPNDLIDPEIETEARLAVYRAKYAGCPEGALGGDASTAYAKKPTYEGVPERAKRLLGADIKLIYMTRDPIKRITSQYHHLWGLEMENRPMAEAVLEDEQYISYSRYGWQLDAWRAHFPEAQIMVVRFEDYLADRPKHLAEICAFLGVEAPVQNPDETHRNKSEGKKIVKSGSMMQKFAHSRFYLFTIKPLIPTNLRDKVKDMILPTARPMTEKLSDDTRAKLVAALRDDALAGPYLK